MSAALQRPAARRLTDRLVVRCGGCGAWRWSYVGPCTSCVLLAARART